MKRHLIIALAILIITAGQAARADEGMYPLSVIKSLDLRSKGLKVKPSDIYSPGRVGLIDAIVQIGGCTGSFVSPDGLIITNHHCVFGVVQAASTPEKDYLTNGFAAGSRQEELQAKGYTVRITESYQDVSREVLGAVTDTMDPGARTLAIDAKIRQIVARTEKGNPGKRAEVAEMFAGKSYTLFLYTYLKDVRAVYVPPRAIGEFGGENDNWVWPRHTGDFSFIRAYVAPDGSPAEYSPANLPYHPKKYLKIDPQGVDESDPVFILGYPGRTYRHRTASYLAYEEEIRMPYVADLYEWQIGTLESMGKSDPASAIKVSGRIKGLANTMKNYRGKLAGMGRLHLVQKKLEEEKALQAHILADPKRKALYGGVLEGIEKVYGEMRSRSQYEMTLDYLRQSSTMLGLGFSVVDAARELTKPDAEREAPYMERNFARTSESLLLSVQNYFEQADKVFLKKMLTRAAKLPQGQRIGAIDSLLGGTDTDASISRFLENAFSSTRLKDEKVLAGLLGKSPEAIDTLADPFVKLAKALTPALQELREIRRRRDGTLSRLSALLLDAKQEFQRKDFIPDANSTLRLTFGHIKGYSPADALYASPITTVRGILEKTTPEEPYNTPRKLIDLANSKQFGRFRHKRLKDVPVDLLYDLDTTGGNSGSPLLNARGELVGVNFDRAYEATINDYAWSESYSRSIAVDIRYVLWVLEKFSGADSLLSEMGIPKG